ncbi:MAG: hypothetical protein HEP71_12175 [Roseivirga sp.]|nr:hypothetical protein [Roseivirga sp.]
MLKDAPVYSIQPRNPQPLSLQTQVVFEECNVRHEYVFLNGKYTNYDFANKVVACDYYARHLSEDYLLFLDSDQVVFNNLEEFVTGHDADVQMRVVNLKGVGTNGNDENTAYWKELYARLGVEKPDFIQTGIREQRIFSYYNAGLIFARRTSGLFEQWQINFEQIMDSGLKPEEGLFFVEQSTLSATISSMGLTMKELPVTYNYSPQTHMYLSASNTQLTLDQIHTFHYHRLFRPPNRVNFQKDFTVFQGPKLDWLKRELVSCGINPQPFYKQWELDLLAQKEQVVQQIRAKNGTS